jgi:hypothetical protein
MLLFNTQQDLENPFDMNGMVSNQHTIAHVLSKAKCSAAGLLSTCV